MSNAEVHIVWGPSSPIPGPVALGGGWFVLPPGMMAALLPCSPLAEPLTSTLPEQQGNVPEFRDGKLGKTARAGQGNTLHSRVPDLC